MLRRPTFLWLNIAAVKLIEQFSQSLLSRQSWISLSQDAKHVARTARKSWN